MATHKGSEGTIKVGSNAVSELLSYSITENVDLIETTNISDAARLYSTGKTSWVVRSPQTGTRATQPRVP